MTSRVKKPATVVDVKTATPDSSTTAPPIPPTQVEAREEVTRTSAILQRQSLPDFSTALSWDVMTDRYNEFVKSFGKTSTLNRKKRQVNRRGTRCSCRSSLAGNTERTFPSTRIHTTSCSTGLQMIRFITTSPRVSFLPRTDPQVSEPTILPLPCPIHSRLYPLMRVCVFSTRPRYGGLRATIASPFCPRAVLPTCTITRSGS